MNYVMTLLLFPILAAILIGIARQGPNVDELWRRLSDDYNIDPIHALFGVFSLVLTSTVYFMSRPRPVYLVDFSCFKPPSRLRVPFATFREHARLVDFLGEKSIRFMNRILERSGLGEETCLPPLSRNLPPSHNLEASRAEAQLVMFSAVDDLLRKTGLSPRDIDVLVVNCSLFSPTPSLSAMLINRYKLRSNVKSFNLSGMGCSAGLISVDLARDLLQVHAASYALVVSTEIMTPNYYTGNNPCMLLPNVLFRMGSAAVLLSNRRSECHRARYRLLHVVRTHRGGDDGAYGCVQETEDADGKTGVALAKDLMVVAGDALKSNITAIGPLVLPASEQLFFLLSLVSRKLLGTHSKWSLKPYIPDFKRAFEHFCIHAGGRAVIDELQKSLQLSSEHVEASRMALYRFGNTSSSSLWYELSYIESKGRMRRGDRVWMIGFGSGFKCNSAVWKCIRSVPTPVEGPWADCIHRYPVDVPEIVKM